MCTLNAQKPKTDAVIALIKKVFKELEDEPTRVINCYQHIIRVEKKFIEKDGITETLKVPKLVIPVSCSTEGISNQVFNADPSDNEIEED